MDFSAQFGGKDAASRVLPHFRALKAASQGVSPPHFPCKKMVFVLRVDGDVNAFGLSGLGNLDVQMAEFISLDVGVPESVTQLGDGAIATHIANALKDATAYLEMELPVAKEPFNLAALREGIAQVIQAYESVFLRG